MKAIVCMDREAILESPDSGEILKRFIPEGYYGPGDREAEDVTLYLTGPWGRAL